MFAEVARKANANLEFAFGFVKVVEPFRGVSEIEHPLPVAVTLPQDDFLLDLGFVTGETRLEIQGQPHGMIRGVEHHVTILQRNASETELGNVNSHGWV